MTDSEIISAEALISALKQQSTFPDELQAEFLKLGETLAADPNYIDRAIQRCIELVSTHPPLQRAFEVAGKSLQASANNNRKSFVDYSEANGHSQEIRNRFRDELLIAGNDKLATTAVSKNPVAKLFDRLLGKK